MKKKLFKFLIAASVVTVFASVASLAASITIDSVDEVNTTTGDVKVSFTATDMASADQVTALVYTPNAQNSGPVDTNIVYIDQNSNGTYSGKLNFKMKAGVAEGTECTLLMGGTGVATAASTDFTYTTFSLGYNVSGTVSGVTVFEYSDPDLLEMMFGDKASTFGFTINLKTIDQTTILQTANVTYNGTVFTYTFPEKVKAGEYAVQIYKPGFLVRNFAITVGSDDLVIEDKDLKYGDIEEDCIVDTTDTSLLFRAINTNIEEANSVGVTYNHMYDSNADCIVDTTDTSVVIVSYKAGYTIEVYEEDQSIDIGDLTLE